MRLSLSPRSEHLAALHGSEVRLLDVASGDVVFSVQLASETQNGQPTVSFSPSGQSLAVITDNQTVQLWKSDANYAVGVDVSTELSLKDWETKFAMQFQPDGTLTPRF
jgi:hypothetical protein